MPAEGPMCAAASGAAESERASSEEPMTALQAYNLKMLSEQARELDAFDRALTKAEASRRINALKAKLWLAGEPPHTA